MSRVSFGDKLGRSRSTVTKDLNKTIRQPEEVVRDLKKGQQKPPGEDYRERALALFGWICARCGREFDSTNRQLLTIHHRDGNHYNNPPDGSNWELLCAFCHEDAHSREILGEYLEGAGGGKETSLVYGDNQNKGWNALGDKLKKVLEEKKKS